MTQPIPEQAVPPTPAPTPTPPAPASPAPATDAGDPGKGGKDAILADLARERDKRQELEGRFQALTDQQKQQADAFAKALGIAPEDGSDADKLAATVSDLQTRFAEQELKATRLEVAAANQIPAEFQGWLTATDPAQLDAQAKALMPMVAATLAARGQSPLLPGAPVPPAGLPIPGQGQSGYVTPEQQAAAGYSEFYDEHGRPRR